MDQIYVTRRVLVFKSIVAAGFLTLVGRLTQLQLVRGEQYERDAASNSINWKEFKPTRGLIFDRTGRPLAENRRTWEVRIIPTQLPKRGTPEWESLRERLITALRLPDCLVINPNAVPIGAETTVYTRVAILLGATTQSEVDQYLDYIKIIKEYNNILLIEDRLSADLAAKIRAAKEEIPGAEVVNYFDYLVTNYRYQETPLTVKRDVARDVALKLEANRLYLPGVELDDTVLTRSYPGGPVMSHILGYVGKIQDDDLNSEKNLAGKNGDTPIYKFYQPDDYIGQTGIERQLEEILRGQKGGMTYEQDGHGAFIRELPGKSPAVPGKNLRLTIDLELQAAISKALADGIEFSSKDRAVKFPDKPANCRGGAVVVMSPKNGEVYALVSYPNYDNQLFIEGLSLLKAREYGLGLTDEESAELRSKPGVTDPLTDRAYAGHYPPGSTLKLFVALAGLREGKVSGDTRYRCTGAMRVPYTWDETKGDLYLCWIHKSGEHGDVNVIEAIERSCDIYFYNVGTPRQRPEGAADYLHYRDFFTSTQALGDTHDFEGLGIKLLKRNLHSRFWFGEKTGIDLPQEAEGVAPDAEWMRETYNTGWSAGDTINASIGQGYFLASPLQIAVNTAALCNGGIIYRPRIVKAIVDDKGDAVQVFKAEQLRKLKFSAEHMGLVLEGMRRVVHSETGTAHHSIDPVTYQNISKWPLTNPSGEEEITIGGKTGTAEVGQKNEDGTYPEAHAWWTCFAPFDDPEVVVTVFLERGGEGSSYAVPVADKALRAYFELKGRRKRGVMLREDERPINERTPPPPGNAGALEPGEVITTGD